MRLEQAHRDQLIVALAAVTAGGEYTDPVGELYTELEAPLESPEHPDAELRRALGLRI